MSRILAAALAAGLTAIAVGCLGENQLSGSVSELFPLDVSRVEILRNDLALQVSYYNNRGTDIDLVARVTLALDGIDLTPGKNINLAGEYAPGHQRTAVIHLPAGQLSRTLPDVKQGDLQLDKGGAPGQLTQGNFSLSFVADGSYGSGRSMQGKFSGPALDAGYGDWPPP